jgi:undecaprenyl-diphosphatase
VKYMNYLYEMECKFFRVINQNFKRKYLNQFFHGITHLGGATFTITATLLILFFSTGQLKMTALASAISLTISHLPVAIMKKLYPRKRPYLVLDEIFVTDKPLKDHSFPSGHTTAIFAFIMPFILYSPLNSISILLLFLAITVGLSRMVLGLHYPSDVIVGCVLGSLAGLLAFEYMYSNYLHVFI